MAFIVKKTEDNKLIVEKYIDSNGKAWVRIKFMDKYRTEVILSELEFEKRYGKIEQDVA